MACQFVLFDPFNILRIWKFHTKIWIFSFFWENNCKGPGSIGTIPLKATISWSEVVMTPSDGKWVFQLTSTSTTPPTCLALYAFECKILLSLSSSLSSAGSSIIINLRVAPKPIPSLLLCLPLEFQASIWSHLLSVFTCFYSLYFKECWWITLLLLQLNKLRTDMSLGEDENTTSYPSSSMDGQGRVPAPLVVNTKEGWAHRGLCRHASRL